MTKLDMGNNIFYHPDEKGYIMFDLTRYIPLQTSRIVNGVNLLPKNEYHCSLVAIERYFEDKEEALRVVDSIKTYLQTHELQFIELGQERYICTRDERTTLVAPVSISGIEKFQAFVGSLIPGFDPPFSHITLLKSEATEFGIGINSIDELRRYCTLLEP